MYKKNEILSNPREFSSEQIAEAIKAGVLTMYELSKSGNLTPLMKKRIEDKLAGSDANTSRGSAAPQPQPQNVQPKEVQPKIEQPEVSQPKVSVTTPIQERVPKIEIPEPPSDNGPYNTPPPITPNNVGPKETKKTATDNKGMFLHPLSFKGRIRRLEYGISFLLSMVGYFIAMALVAAAESNPDGAVGLAVILLILYIFILWFMYAQGAKRCHDLGHCGWWQLIPFYGFWMLFAEGDRLSNEYGNNPKD